MNDNTEQLLAKLTPCRTANELRAQVLGAVGGELKALRQWRRQRRIGLATFAAVLFSVALNVWVEHSTSRRITSLFGPPPVCRQAMELANFIAPYTDAQTGQWIYQQMTSYQPTEKYTMEKYFSMLQKINIEYELLLRDPRHEKMEENSPLDGNRNRNFDHNSSHNRGLLFLDYRFTA
jgi:hypothetical protein